MNVQLVSPVRQLLSVSTQHETAGLPGFPAHDWFAPARTAVVSPAAGVVSKLSGHSVAEGLIDGPHGPYGLSVYVQSADGSIWYLTHLAQRLVALGERVQRGELLGTVALWPHNVTPPHVHLGVHSP